MGDMKLQDIIGVIFDFNGTMFFDSEKHIRAWASYVEEVTGVAVNSGDIEKYISGKPARQIMEHFLGYEISDSMLEQFSEEKEGVYRRLCNEDKAGLTLAPGLTKFLDYLAEYDIPRTIATTTSLSNIMYYFEVFDLYRWFEPDKLVYRDQRIREKPYPDMYLVACKLLQKQPARCLVFEDSVTGITAAEAAGIRHIVAVKGDNPNLSIDGFNHVHAVIRDYTELNDTLDF